MSLTPINGNGWGLAPDIFHPYHTHTYILIHRFLVGDSIAIKLDSSPSTSSPKRRGAVLELFHIHHLWLGHAHQSHSPQSRGVHRWVFGVHEIGINLVEIYNKPSLSGRVSL
jgi:hypothetical protein